MRARQPPGRSDHFLRIIVPSSSKNFWGSPCSTYTEMMINTPHLDQNFLINSTLLVSLSQFFFYLKSELMSMSWKWTCGNWTPSSVILLSVATLNQSLPFPLHHYLPSIIDIFGTKELTCWGCIILQTDYRAVVNTKWTGRSNGNNRLTYSFVHSYVQQISTEHFSLPWSACQAAHLQRKSYTLPFPALHTCSSSTFAFHHPRSLPGPTHSSQEYQLLYMPEHQVLLELKFFHPGMEPIPSLS